MTIFQSDRLTSLLKKLANEIMSSSKPSVEDMFNIAEVVSLLSEDIGVDNVTDAAEVQRAIKGYLADESIIVQSGVAMLISMCALAINEGMENNETTEDPVETEEEVEESKMYDGIIVTMHSMINGEIEVTLINKLFTSYEEVMNTVTEMATDAKETHAQIICGEVMAYEEAVDHYGDNAEVLKLLSNVRCEAVQVTTLFVMGDAFYVIAVCNEVRYDGEQCKPLVPFSWV